MWLRERYLRCGQTHQMYVAPSPRLPHLEALLLASKASLRLVAGTQTQIFVLSGRCSIVMGEGRAELCARSWMVLDVEGSVSLSAGAGALILVLSFTAGAIKALAAHGRLRVLPGQGRINPETMRHLVFAIRNAEEPTTHFWQREALIRTLFRRLVLLQGELLGLLAACPGKSSLHKQQVLARLQRARLHMEMNSDRNIRIAELASIAHYSRWFFTKAFHRVYGLSPKCYTTRVRLVRASGLLRDGQASIGGIAQACGFVTATAFSRAFRHHFGVSPTELRGERPASRLAKTIS